MAIIKICPYDMATWPLRRLLEKHQRSEEITVRNIRDSIIGLYYRDEYMATPPSQDFSFYDFFLLDLLCEKAGEDHEEITPERWMEYKIRLEHLERHKIEVESPNDDL